MKKILAHSFLVTVIFFISSCDCTNVDCEDISFAETMVELEIVKDNDDAIFGMSPIISISDVSIKSEDGQVPLSSEGSRISTFLRL